MHAALGARGAEASELSPMFVGTTTPVISGVKDLGPEKPGIP